MNENIINETPVVEATPAPAVAPQPPVMPATEAKTKPDALTYAVGGFALFGAANAIYWAVRGGIFVGKKIKEAVDKKKAAPAAPVEEPVQDNEEAPKGE